MCYWMNKNMGSWMNKCQILTFWPYIQFNIFNFYENPDFLRGIESEIYKKYGPSYLFVPPGEKQ